MMKIFSIRFSLSSCFSLGSSWVSYSIDGVENVMITESLLLVEVTEGSHSIIIYADDTVRNMGVSSIIPLALAYNFRIKMDKYHN